MARRCFEKVVFPMGKKLVAYFSASGTTAAVAKTMAEALEADLFEIVPKEVYTKADLNWNDQKSRSSVEMRDCTFRPAVARTVENMQDYDTVFVGFPIWWYVAPTIINTFLESYELGGKTVVPFATSGGSGMGKTNEALRASCPDFVLREGKVFKKNVSRAEILDWAKQLK